MSGLIRDKISACDIVGWRVTMKCHSATSRAHLEISLIGKTGREGPVQTSSTRPALSNKHPRRRPLFGDLVEAAIATAKEQSIQHPPPER